MKGSRYRKKGNQTYAINKRHEKWTKSGRPHHKYNASQNSGRYHDLRQRERGSEIKALVVYTKTHTINEKFIAYTVRENISDMFRTRGSVMKTFWRPFIHPVRHREWKNCNLKHRIQWNARVKNLIRWIWTYVHNISRLALENSHKNDKYNEKKWSFKNESLNLQVGNYILGGNHRQFKSQQTIPEKCTTMKNSYMKYVRAFGNTNAKSLLFGTKNYVSWKDYRPSTASAKGILFPCSNTRTWRKYFFEHLLNWVTYLFLRQEYGWLHSI